MRVLRVGGLLAILALQGCMYAKPSDSDIRAFEAKLPSVCGKPIGSYERYYAYHIGAKAWVGSKVTVDFGKIDASYALDERGKTHGYSVVRPPDLPAWFDRPGVVYLRLHRKTGVIDIFGCDDGGTMATNAKH